MLKLDCLQWKWVSKFCVQAIKLCIGSADLYLLIVFLSPVFHKVVILWEKSFPVELEWRDKSLLLLMSNRVATSMPALFLSYQWCFFSPELVYLFSFLKLKLVYLEKTCFIGSCNLQSRGGQGIEWTSDMVRLCWDFFFSAWHSSLIQLLCKLNLLMW